MTAAAHKITGDARIALPGEPNRPNRIEHHAWLSDSELVFVRDGELGSYDVAERTFQLSHLFEGVSTNSSFRQFFMLSPDRRWVLWRQGHGATMVAAVDGTGTSRRSREGFTYWHRPFWSTVPDRWVEVEFTTISNESPNGREMREELVRFVERDAAGRDPDQLITSIPDGLKYLRVIAAPSLALVVAREMPPIGKSWSMGFARGRSVVATVYRPRESETISVWDVEFEHPTAQWHIELPGRMCDCVATPKADRLAWLIDGRGRDRVGIWSSYLDGSHMRRLAGFPTPGLLAPAVDYPRGLAWLPGGNAISFAYDGAIWTVPVDYEAED